MNNRTLANQNPLTDEKLQLLAPSAFAGQAYQKQSDRYAFIPTIEVIQAMRNHGYLPFTASQSRTKIEGKEFFTKHMIRFRSADNGLLNVGDSKMEMVLINSHDGTSAYKLMLGVFRLVCSNGMVVSESLAQSINIRHTGDVVSQVLSGTERLIASAPLLQKTMDIWRQITLDQNEANLFAEQAMTLRFGNESPVTIEQVLRSRRNEDSGLSLWKVFNRVQEALVRGGLRYIQPTTKLIGGVEVPDTRRNKTREVKGIDQNTTLNKALWTLGEKMAELKQS